MAELPRVVFVGAIEGSKLALETLIEHGLVPVAVATLPLSKAHRHSDFVDLRPLAQAAGSQVLEISNCNSPEALQSLRELQPDLIFVMGWSQICRAEFLAIPTQGCIGYHPAPLPVNRGRAVIPWTILQDREQTGCTLFWLDDGVDSGDILAQQCFPVSADETAGSLYRKHLDALQSMLAENIPLLLQHRAPRRVQDHSSASWCARRRPEHGLIDWQRDAAEVWRLVRAVGEPYPGAFSYFAGQKLTVWSADWVGEAPHSAVPGQIVSIDAEGALVQCGDGLHLRLIAVQLEGQPVQQPLGVLKRHEQLGR
ncbi:MAG: methionyl-tRNA formyltransferase [Rickettsiales bacterium]|nr:methionyl-tRNA formyltransferase [Rickettsiales bacterium]|tara:strand:- start:453 stop:1385 length:933 start_codon:yes stop_codon:yes gene_type:complete